MKNILVVAAHPDDGVLGCGGVIAKHIESGDKVTVVTFTNGISSRINVTNKEKTIREKEHDSASTILGITVIGHNYADQELDVLSLLFLSRVIGDSQFKLGIIPDIVYTHYANDLNQDHRQLHHATMIAFRPKQKQTCKEIYCYQVPSYGNNNFNPNYYVSLTEKQVELKLQAWDCYKSEHNERFNRESLLRIMQECGNSIGVNYAEAFEIARIIK